MVKGNADLLLRVAPYNQTLGTYPVEATLSDGSRFHGGQLRINWHSLLVQELQPETYGLILFNALFAGPIKEAYDRALDLAEMLRLRLWIEDGAAELHALPWERLYHHYKGHAVPLAATADTPFSRYTSLTKPEPELITQTPLQLLVVVSNPVNLPGALTPVDVDAEVENLRKALAPLLRENLLRVSVLPGRTGLSADLQRLLKNAGWQILSGPASLDNLMRQLPKCHLFHFIGHGSFQRKDQHGPGHAALHLEKDDGTWVAVRDDDFVSRLVALEARPHLMFFVACESAKRDVEHPFVGLGPKLVQADIPAVVAMQDQAPMAMVRDLTAEFYRQLTAHGEVDTALNQARLQVFDAKRTEWAIPVLFTRLRDGRLFALGEAEFAVPGEPPYKGLRYFDEQDADNFFGRDALTAELVERVRVGRFVAVVGGSGSGKSSLVRAGIVPILRHDEHTRWHIHVITPTSQPLESLATSLTRDSASVTLAARLMDDLRDDQRALHLFARRLVGGDDARLLLVVDQFEELFTACKDPALRKQFVNNLLTAVQNNGPITLLLSLRADFYAHCAQYDGLRDALEKHQKFIDRLKGAELQQAIEEPARRGGWELEHGLDKRVLNDAGDQPGALPLISHALLATWNRRRGRRLTLAGYQATGGVKDALTHTADETLSRLMPEQRAIARRIFTRLTELGEGTQDTRRRARLDELSPRLEDRPEVEQVLAQLATARLVITDRDAAEVPYAEVVHEALIREWPQLQGWLGEDRDNLRRHRQLIEDAQQWSHAKDENKENYLYRGSRLSNILERANWSRIKDELGELEISFIRASEALGEREREERLNREKARIEAEHQKLMANRLLRLSQIIAGLGALATVLAIVASAAFALANQQARLATARQLAADAVGKLDVDSELSILLALQAVDQTHPPDKTALDALYRAVQASRIMLTLSGHGGHVNDIAYSPDGKLIATVSDDKTIKVWDALLGQEISSLSGHTDWINSVDFSSDGKRLVTASFDHTARVWDVEMGREVLTLFGHDSNIIRDATFSPDGKLIATASADSTAIIWDAISGNQLITLVGHQQSIWGVAFHPDGTRLATGSSDQTAKIWNVATGQQLLSLADHIGSVLTVAFSPDGSLLITGSDDHTAKIWDSNFGHQLLTIYSGHAFHKITFDSKGTRIAAAGADNTATVWNILSGQALFTVSDHSGPVTGIAFSPNGRRIVTSSWDNTARIWDADAGHSGPIARIAYSPDGTRIASAGADATARLWNALSGRELLALIGHSDRLTNVAFSPDGTKVATASHDRSVKIWDAVAGNTLNTLVGFILAPTDIAFSPDGARLVTGSEYGAIHIWDVASGKELLNWRHTEEVLPVFTVAFSPDGRRVASGGSKTTAKVWDAFSGQLLLTLSGHSLQVVDIAFSPDGSKISTADLDGTAKVWNAVSGRELFTFNGHSGPLISIAFSSDGHHVVTTSSDRTIKIWDSTSGQEQMVITDPVTNAIFSPDGTRLAAGGSDYRIHTYILNVEDLVSFARTRVTRSLTTVECRKYVGRTSCPLGP